MKDLKQFILEYKKRIKNSFDYVEIRKTIESCKPTFWGKLVDIEALWTPQIYFIYDKGWAAGEPDKEFFHGKDYKNIELGSSTVLFISFYAEKKLFKENILRGTVNLGYPNLFNDEDKKNWEEVEKYMESKFNAEHYGGKILGTQKYFEFKTYEELEELLKGLEKVINEYNTNYDKTNAAYLYFDKNEAEQNSSDKKKQYEIMTCEEEIVKLNKQLEDVKKAASASDTDMTTLIDAINEKIKFFKDKKEKIEK